MIEITLDFAPDRLRPGLQAALDFVAGKTRLNVERVCLNGAVQRLCDHGEADYDAEAVWFTDGTGLLVAVTPTGPGYSEVTPDPEWPASVNYFSIQKP